ncbi:serine hydrolase domain-containing protein [Planococcus lenghuensis]|uniref:Beta-lactamase-related domain-containing protein n=1 Tax=Planococcus lenghuensis TaxID=2213202 RepID=A0A1Q2L598_9BACL|nr:serine hydrolase domain-containing protein [Planococcus lenghuensis]AQQ55544.1 hypothetical protein B0X71_20430 [Planococcus lenghuensis]
MEDFKEESRGGARGILESRNFSGSVLIAKKRDIVFKESFGMANYELDVSNSSETKYRIGSITKLFTATAIMQLVEQQRLKLESTVDRYITDYPNGNRIKISHLLNHTSGIANLTEFPDFPEWVKTYSPVKETIDRFKQKPLDFPPGKGYRYSNSGYILLSYILELVTDQLYEQYLEENIFASLGIVNTGFDRQEIILRQRAAGYNLKGEELINAPFIHMSNPYGAASLYSTTEDLFRFVQAFFKNELVNEQNEERMLQPSLGKHGLGWMTKQARDQQVAHHGGGINGFSANLMRYIDDEVTIIILANVFYPKSTIEEISKDLAHVVFQTDSMDS